ncbi:hypothetical protein tb265_16710 [Gemmatimonadetes bacterium T265]|nr:hypothetical protein tb265_16710 [Gemmatimonadetes bacterium T265]
MKDTPENDRSEYTDTGFRDGDARQGFGDDGGTRVGRPDGVGSNASAARPAPYDGQGGHQIPGQPGTNTTPVPDGIEGSEIEDMEQGQQQSRVQDAAKGITPGPAAGDDRPTYDL